ncbi:MAG: hypothetical protein JWM11_634 [Planctomycetaceae bacterium]|nr:hypothetical protein [Planctomycetaceae bacterium]
MLGAVVFFLRPGSGCSVPGREVSRHAACASFRRNGWFFVIKVWIWTASFPGEALAQVRLSWRRFEIVFAELTS